MGLKSPYRPCAPPTFLAHGNPRTLSQCHTETRASLDANPGQSQKHPLGERGAAWGQIPGPATRWWGTSLGRTQTQPVGWESPHDSRRPPGRWPGLTLTLFFLPRAESEVPPRPASPKVSRSPSEAATPTEDMARKSKLAWGGRGERRAGSGAVFSDSWRGQESRQPRAQVCCLALWVQIPAL